jgi:hypothetical protein
LSDGCLFSQYPIIVYTTSSTLFRGSSGCSAIEGLWGTLDLWTDRLRGNPGSEEGERALPPEQQRNCATLNPEWGGEKEGPYRAVGPSRLQSISVYCSLLHGRRRKYASLLGFLAIF